jgi:hypothetical protein
MLPKTTVGYLGEARKMRSSASFANREEERGKVW